MKKQLYSLFGVFAFAMMLSLVPTNGAHALTIIKPQYDYALNPGDVAMDVIQVVNEESAPITLYPELWNFEASKDESGIPSFYPPKENHNGQALAPWITVNVDSFTLQPGERKNISVSVNVPKDQAQPGGHYGAIVFATTAPDPNGNAPVQISLAQQVGSLFLVNVSGDLKEKASILEFGLKEKKPWFNYRPIDMYVRVENGGNAHIRPTGNVFITNWFGRQSAAPTVNSDFKSILPFSIRKFDIAWDGKDRNEAKGFMENLKKEWRNFGFGRYTAQLYLNYGSQHQMLSSTTTFTIWPWRIILLVVLALLLVLLILTKGMKGYNQRVIKKYERMMKK